MMSMNIKTSKNRFSALSDFAALSENKKEKKNTATTKDVLNDGQKKKPQKNKKRKDNNLKKHGGQKGSESLNNFSSSHSSTAQPLSEDWVKKDENLVDQMFHDDIWKAIELSKQDHEKSMNEKAQSSTLKNTNLSPSIKRIPDDSSKEKKPKSTKALSLDKFHQYVENQSSITNNHSVKEVKPVKTKVNPGSDFFSKIDKAVTRIENKEHRQKPSPPVSNSLPDVVHVESGDADSLSLATVFNHTLKTDYADPNDARIHELEEEVESWKDKYQQVKKRNQQLLVILQQGEMKDKSELLVEMERLSQIRDELTEEVSDLNECLEKERSKVSKLKDELKVQSSSKKKS